MQPPTISIFRKYSYLKVFYANVYCIFNCSRSYIRIYMYLKFRTKDGEEGPRGYHGHPEIKVILENVTNMAVAVIA